MSEGSAPVPARFAGRPGRVVLALAAIAVGLGACEGDNLFTGEGPSFDPRILEIDAPEFVFAGDTITVLVQAAAAREVEQIVISARGAANVDTVVQVAEPKQKIAQVVKIGIPAIVQDSLLRITASVIDAVGAQSPPRELLVTAAGPPVIQTVGGPSGVRPGDLINLRIRAFGTRPISRVDIAARGAINKDTTVVISPASVTVEQDVAFRIPSLVQDTVITFNVTAQDEAGVTSAPRSTLVPFAIDTPSVNLLTPPVVEAGAVLTVAVAAQSLRQITEVGIELSGGIVPTRVERAPLSPAQASTVKYFAVSLPANLVVPEIRVQAYAIDKTGSRSMTPPQIVTVPSTPPAVVTVDPFATTVLAGLPINVRVVATGVRPLKEVRIRMSVQPVGASPVLEGGADEVAVIDPPRTFVAEDFALQSPCLVGGGSVLLLVTARDVDDRLSGIVSRLITLAANPACAPEEPEDTTAAPRMPRARIPGLGASGSEPLSFGEAAPFLGVESRRWRRGRRKKRHRA